MSMSEPDLGKVGQREHVSGKKTRANRLPCNIMKIATRLNQVHNQDTENKK